MLITIDSHKGAIWRPKNKLNPYPLVVYNPGNRNFINFW